MEAAAIMEYPLSALANGQKPGGRVWAQSLARNKSIPGPELCVTEAVTPPRSLLSHVMSQSLMWNACENL